MSRVLQSVRSAAFTLALVGFCAQCEIARAQDDGARAYTLVPDGTRVATVQTLFLRANQSLGAGTVVKGADFDIDVAVAQFTQTFALQGRQAAAFAALPLGHVRGHVSGAAITGSSSGLGDTTVGLIVGLRGSPALSAESYIRHRPGFALGVLGKIELATGDYDSERAVNLGANRRTYQIGMPMTFARGDSPVDGELATFELVPALTFFEDNDEPFGANRVAQDPLFTVEAHLTRNLSPSLWISADARYSRGGETQTDGVSDENPKRGFALGATANLTFNARLSLKTTYGSIVARSDEGPDGWMLRAILNYAF